MDTKHIHCMLEKISEYGKQMMEEAVGAGNVNLDDAGKIVDMVKDLACAEKDALIAKEMRKAHEDEEAEEKYMMKMLKDEHKDEYKRMREEYGEDEGERRFYDNYRYKSSGRFAPKGRGSYMPRRGYEEPPYYHMTPDMMREHDPEYWRDLDRKDGKMYYTPMTDGRMDGSTHTGGDVRGYSDGYSDGMRDGKKNSESRYDRARRGYEEKKSVHKENTAQDNSENMKGLEELLNVIDGDVKEFLPKMSPSEKTMLKQKFTTWAQKIS